MVENYGLAPLSVLSKYTTSELAG